MYTPLQDRTYYIAYTQDNGDPATARLMITARQTEQTLRRRLEQLVPHAKNVSISETPHDSQQLELKGGRK